MDPLKIKAIELGSDRLYRADFLKRSWLANYVADVDTLVTAYEVLVVAYQALRATLGDASPATEPLAESGPVTLSRTDRMTVHLEAPRDPGREP